MMTMEEIAMQATAMPNTHIDLDAADYALVEEAIRFLERNLQSQPRLEDLAEHLSLSPFHLQRLFTRWAGISPKRFLQYMTVEHAKKLLEESKSVLDATLESGLSSPGRLHDLFVTVEAMTPGEYKAQGAGLQMRYGRHNTPFGEALLATTDRGLCALSFLNGGGWEGAIAELAGRWPEAHLIEDPRATQPMADRIFLPENGKPIPPMSVLLKGTNFQLKVWEALLRIPPGAVCTYSDIARMIDSPKAARAVGSAIKANPVAFLIPCHRVIRQSGIISDYRWGSARKRAILGWEAARHESQFGDRDADDQADLREVAVAA
jgi:AraC family transcriptional regulator of adaptative response/methylated-DNA-[protein]-cysteine methyltransferase